MPNYKFDFPANFAVVVSNKRESKYMQRWAFENGFQWHDGGDRIIEANVGNSYVLFDTVNKHIALYSFFDQIYQTFAGFILANGLSYDGCSSKPTYKDKANYKPVFPLGVDSNTDLNTWMLDQINKQQSPTGEDAVSQYDKTGQFIYKSRRSGLPVHPDDCYPKRKISLALMGKRRKK